VTYRASPRRRRSSGTRRLQRSPRWPRKAAATRKPLSEPLARYGHIPYSGAVMTTDRKSVFRLIPCNATALRQASRRLTQLYDVALEPCGLRSTQLAILSELAYWSADAPTLAELADALAIDRSSLGHNLRPLEREGLVVLGESAVDGRRRHIALTSKGKAKWREGLRLWRVAQERFEQVFGRSEAAALRATLLGIAHHKRLASLKD
jgi:DNA-binding MarR family transcriptional regulator